MEQCFSSERTIVTAFKKIKAREIPVCFNSLMQYSLHLRNGFQTTRAVESQLWKRVHIYI